MMMPQSQHAAFLSDIRHSLAPGGTLILVNRVRGKRPEAQQAPASNYAAEMLAGLTARGIPLPEAREHFHARLSDYAEAQKPWSNAVVTLEHVEEALAQAGFHVRERIDHDRRRTIPARDGGAPAKMMTHIFVATPGSV